MKIAILMSTYNGQEYLAMQLDSLQEQTYEDWDLYIRDDGSTDATLKVIKQYQAKDKRIHLYQGAAGKNLGVVGSFFELFRNVQADFYMFCDQDDVWLPTKIATTLAAMLELRKQNDSGVPLLVHTNKLIVDQQLNLLHKPSFEKRPHDLISIVFFNNVTGCTVMVDNNLKKYACRADLKDVFLHDHWVALVAALLGKIAFVEEPLIKYRQHGNNQYGGQDFFAVLKSSKLNKKIASLRRKWSDKSWPTKSLPVRQINQLYKLFFAEASAQQKQPLKAVYQALNGSKLERQRFIKKDLPHQGTTSRRILSDLFFVLGGKGI
ncbi:MAG: glycosyltransferase family 2 protein [Liquorilactobacillus ghanensis]|uniref:glycosyltransferase family 2 protein n=1 Tax=Liquorilactobacillus ghanensis TaxID=399370 RepID=UPI0039ED5FAF